MDYSTIEYEIAKKYQNALKAIISKAIERMIVHVDDGDEVAVQKIIKHLETTGY